MSLVPANITVNFTAAYVGNHRVCYRIGNSGPYSCTTVNCAGNNTGCSLNIPIFVDNETCVNVQFNGYVQPTCIDISSTLEQVPFSSTFVPSPACKSYVVTCNSSYVTTPTMLTAGSGYDPLSPPSVLITGGGGIGAVGVAAVGSGVITVPVGVISLNGSGYVNGTYNNVNITGGSGTGAKATVVVAGTIVTAITVTTMGTGYHNTDVLGVNYLNMGMGAPPVSSAKFTVTTDYGTVTGITITTPGSGYTSAPNITIGTAGGVQATASGNLGGCPAISTTGCDGSLVILPANVVHVGESVTVCNLSGVPAVDPVYTASLSGNCLCSGNTATLRVVGSVGQEVRYFYNRKNGGVKSGILIVGGSPSQIIDCVIPGSVKFQQISAATLDVTYGGAC